MLFHVYRLCRIQVHRSFSLAHSLRLSVYLLVACVHPHGDILLLLRLFGRKQHTCKNLSSIQFCCCCCFANVCVCSLSLCHSLALSGFLYHSFLSIVYDIALCWRSLSIQRSCRISLLFTGLRVCVSQWIYFEHVLLCTRTCDTDECDSFNVYLCAVWLDVGVCLCVRNCECRIECQKSKMKRWRERLYAEKSRSKQKKEERKSSECKLRRSSCRDCGVRTQNNRTER